MAVIKDISRSRKAYSYYRPRPRPVLITTENEMNTITTAINKVANLDSIIAGITGNNVQIVWNEVPSGMINGINLSFTLEFTPKNGRVLVFINGIIQEGDSNRRDFYITDRTITFDNAPRSGSKVLVTYNKA